MGSGQTPIIESETITAGFRLPWASLICSLVLRLPLYSEILRAKSGPCDLCDQCGVTSVVSETCFRSQSRRENMTIQVGCVTHLNRPLKGVAVGCVFIIASHAPAIFPVM